MFGSGVEIVVETAVEANCRLGRRGWMQDRTVTIGCSIAGIGSGSITEENITPLSLIMLEYDEELQRRAEIARLQKERRDEMARVQKERRGNEARQREERRQIIATRRAEIISAFEFVTVCLTSTNSFSTAIKDIANELTPEYWGLFCLH
jgi:hypothetical protein